MRYMKLLGLEMMVFAIGATESSTAGPALRSKSGFSFAAARQCLCESGEISGSGYRLFRGAKSESNGSRYF